MSAPPHLNSPEAFVLPSCCFFQITGPDATSFLQGQITQSVHDASPDAPLYTAFCNTEGRVLFLAHLWKREDTFYLYSPSPLREKWQTHLKKYSRFSKVQISDLSQQYEAWVSWADPPDTHDEDFFWQAPLHSEILRPRQPTMIPAEPDWTTAWKIARISAFYPVLHPETSGVFLAHHLNLHRMKGINFQKGCYLGQEIIARTEFRGKPKRELRLLRSPRLDLNKIHAGQSFAVGSEIIGQVVETVFDSENQEQLILAVIENRYVIQNQIEIPGQPDTHLRLRPPVIA